MSTSHTRRDAVKLMGAAAVGATLPIPSGARRLPSRSAAEEDLRGLFVILSTPYTESGAVDYDDLAFQVEWLEHAGVHGLVWPQNSSDYPRLTEDEIRRGMETLEPDMMIAMPPKVGSSLEDYRAYYTALARVTSRPVMMQTQPNLAGVEFETDFILELAERFPHLGYVKEEAQPVFDRISALVGQAPIQRVYSAMRGRYFAYDLRLGVDGLVSGMSMYADVFARMWDAYRADDWDDVRDIHGRLLVMLTCEQSIPGAGRYLLHRRGIFRTRRQRGSDVRLSPVQIDEIEHNLRGLEPYLVDVPNRQA